MVSFTSRRTLLTAAALTAGVAVAGTAASASAAEPDATDVAALSRPRRIRIPTGAGTFDAIAAGPRHGRPVLFLHGFPQSSTEWNDYVALFGAMGFRAVAVDQRGYSPDARPADTEDYSLDHLTDDVADIAESLGWNEFDLVGHDWGAAVAWVVAGRYADRVRTLSTVSVPHLGAFSKALRTDPAQQEASAYMDFIRQPGGVAERELLADDAAMLRGLYTKGVSRDDVEGYVKRLSRPGALTAALNWYRANDFSGYEQKITVPTLYMWGTQDDVVAVSGVEDTANWVTGDYRLKKIKGAEHFTPEERPGTVSALILGHLESH